MLPDGGFAAGWSDGGAGVAFLSLHSITISQRRSGMEV